MGLLSLLSAQNWDVSPNDWRISCSKSQMSWFDSLAQMFVIIRHVVFFSQNRHIWALLFLWSKLQLGTFMCASSVQEYTSKQHFCFSAQKLTQNPWMFSSPSRPILNQHSCLSASKVTHLSRMSYSLSSIHQTSSFVFLLKGTGESIYVDLAFEISTIYLDFWLFSIFLWIFLFSCLKS